MRLARTAGALAALLALVAPGRAAAQGAAAESEPAAAVAATADDGGEPARYPPTGVRWKLVAGGLGLTAASYGLGAACAAAWPEVPGAESLYVPVAGPWIALGQSGCSPDDPGCEAIVVARGILYVLSGLVQAGGLAVAGEGLFMTTESESATAPVRAAAITVTPVPLVTETQTGMGVVGAF